MAAVDWEKDRVELEQEVFEIRSQFEDSRKELTEVVKINAELKQQLEKTESERNERVRQVHELETSQEIADSLKADFKRQCQSLSTEKATLSELLDRRNEEIHSLQDEIRTLKTETKTLIFQKCEQQLKFDDLNSREVLLEHREKRWSQEREIILQEKDWVFGELKEREQQIHQIRKDMSMKDLEYRSSLDRYEDESEHMRSLIEDLKEQNSNLSAQCEDLNKKLKQSADSKMSSEEMYENELGCQTKLVQVYKQASDEAEIKVEELTKALENVQQLFNDAKDSHFMMQEHLKVVEGDFAKELKDREEVIIDLKDELEKANELLRSKHRVMLTDEEIAALSPSAASASKLIKSGFTLTQIYREHIKLVEELEQQKLENRRLEQYFRELVHDIETKAPILKQQQDDYFKSLEVIEHLKNQLNAVDIDQNKILSEKDACLRQLTYTKAELERYQRDNGDLSAQVRELLHCMERIRRGDYDLPSRTPDGNLSNEDLLLYRSIDELQATNQRLLSALRQAEAKRDEMIKAAQDAEMSKIKNEMQIALRELDDLKYYREKQDKLLESVTDQRDTYQRLLDTHSAKAVISTTESVLSESFVGESAEIKASLEKLNMEFETYRKGKNEVEKVLNEKVEKLQNVLTDARSTNSKLNTELQYEKERFKILQGNVDSYKKEVNTLRDRNEKYAGSIARHDETIANLTQESYRYREEITKLKVENSHFQEMVRMAQCNESRLDQEVQSLRKSSFNQQILSSTLQELQSRLERTDAEQTLKLRSDVELLTRERNHLQENVKSLNEQNQIYVQNCHAKIAEIETNLENETRKSSRLETHLKWTEEQLHIFEEKAKSYENELKTLRSTFEDATAERFQKEAQQLQTRLNYLEIRYTESTKKVEELTAQYTVAEAELQQFRRLSDSLECGLNDQKRTSELERSSLQTELVVLQSKLHELNSEKEQLLQRLTHAEQEIIVAKSQDSERSSTWTARVKSLEHSLSEVQSELNIFKSKQKELKSDLERESSLTADFRNKFNQEFMSNQENVNIIEELRLQLSSKTARLVEAEAQLMRLEFQATADKERGQNNEKALASETELLRAKVEELQKKNDSLYDDVVKLGNNVCVLERTRSSDPQTSFEGGSVGDADSSQALLEVIQSLRAERQDAFDKSTNYELEVNRLKSRETLLMADITRLSTELSVAEKQASLLAETMAEKGRLVSKLTALQSVQESNKMLLQEKCDLESRVAELSENLVRTEGNLAQYVAEIETLSINFGHLTTEYENVHTAASEWETRYKELLEWRSKFDPEEINRLRTELSEIVNKTETMRSQLQATVNENIILKTSLENASEEKSQLESQFSDLTNRFETLQAEADKNAEMLTRAKKVAQKYNILAQERADKVKALEENVETLKEANSSLENEKADLEAKLKNKPVLEETPASETKELMEKVDILTKSYTELKNTLSETGKKFVSLQKVKIELETKVADLEGIREEQRCRLESLTSFHALCEEKIKKLNAAYKTLSDQYHSEKAAWEKGSETKAGTSLKPALVQAVSAMPAPAVERPSSASQEAARPSVSMKTVASIRPITTPRTIASIPPSAVSPSPSFPDQSCSSAGGLTGQGSSSNLVSTSSNNQTLYPNASTIPLCFVLPVTESSAVSDNTENQGGAISSSSVVITMEPSNSEAAASSEPSTSTASKRKQNVFEQSDFSSKRPRAASPEQVSTSDQASSAVAASASAEQVDLDVGIEEPAEQVGSSLVVEEDEDDDDIVVLDINRSSAEPVESSGQDQNYGESIIVGASAHESDNRSIPWGAAQSQNFFDGDDGIVPSTPTLFSRRLETDTGAAHVPQSRHSQLPHFSFFQPSGETSSMQPHGFGEPAVPSTPREPSPGNGGFLNEAASSTDMGEANVQLDQPQPSGQNIYSEGIDLDSGTDIAESSEATSEAMPVEVEGDMPTFGDDDSNEPTTSESRPVRIRRPITWSEDGGQGPSFVQSTSAPNMPRAPRGRVQTARRTRSGIRSSMPRRPFGRRAP